MVQSGSGDVDSGAHLGSASSRSLGLYNVVAAWSEYLVGPALVTDQRAIEAGLPGSNCRAMGVGIWPRLTTGSRIAVLLDF